MSNETIKHLPNGDFEVQHPADAFEQRTDEHLKKFGEVEKDRREKQEQDLLARTNHAGGSLNTTPSVTAQSIAVNTRLIELDDTPLACVPKRNGGGSTCEACQ